MTRAYNESRLGAPGAKSKWVRRVYNSGLLFVLSVAGYANSSMQRQARQLLMSMRI